MAYSVRTRKTEDKTTHVANVSALKRDPIHNSVSYFIKDFLYQIGEKGLGLGLSQSYVIKSAP